MPVGVDTGFFFALEEGDLRALKVWRKGEIVTSVIVLYELQKKLLQGRFQDWPSLIQDIEASLEVALLTFEGAKRAAHLSHSLKIPGLDSLILATLLEAGCTVIYTTDHHLEEYRDKDVKIVNLYSEGR